MASSRFDLKTPTRLKLGFGLLVGVVVLMGLFGFLEASEARKAFGKAVDHRYPHIAAMQAIQDRTMASSVLQRDMLLASDADALSKAAQAMAALQKENTGALAQLDLAFTSENERSLFEALSNARAQYLVVCQRFLGQALSGEPELAKIVLQTEIAPLEQTYFAALAAMRTFQEAQMQSANAHATAAIRQIQTTLVASGAAALLVAILAAFWSNRAVTQSSCQTTAAAPGSSGKPYKEGDLRVAARPQQQATPKSQPATTVPGSATAGSPTSTAKGTSAGGTEQWESF